jgi:hypothetical protein
LNFEESVQLANVLAKYSPYEAWPDETLRAVEGLVRLGFDGAGDPICLDERTGMGWLLDHEVHFQRREFINSSVPQLQETLLTYPGSTTSACFRERLMQIDPAALEPGAMWTYCAEWIDQED